MVVQTRALLEPDKIQASGDLITYYYALDKGDLYLFPYSKYLDSLFVLHNPERDGFFVVETRFIRFETKEKLNKYVSEHR